MTSPWKLAGRAGVPPAGPGRLWLGDVSGSTSGSPRRAGCRCVGGVLWRATDELLCRPVTIQLLPRGVRV